MIDQLRQTMDLMKRESAEQTQALSSLKGGIELLQMGRAFDQKEIHTLIARLSKEVEDLTTWRHASYRQMWEGDDSIGARLKELQRTMQERAAGRQVLEQDVRELRQDVDELRQSIQKSVDDAIARREGNFEGKIRLERTKGFWALVAAVAVALASAAGLALKQLVE